MPFVPTSSSGSAGGTASSVLSSTTTIAGAAAPFDVSGFSALGNDLLLVAMLRASNASANIDIELNLNNDSGNTYLWQMLEGTGATAVAQTLGALTNFIRIGHAPGSTATASYFGYFSIMIPGYASTTWSKTVEIHNAGASGNGSGVQWVEQLQGQWNNTAAVTRVQIKADDGGAGNFVIGSQLRIYVIT